jgi:hypothetical protein
MTPAGCSHPCPRALWEASLVSDSRRDPRPGFEVSVDGRRVPPQAWQQRRASELVQLLALAPRHRLHREQVIDALWPDLPPDAGAANLRKAAHYGRAALGSKEAVVLRQGQVSLWPDAELAVDAERFETDGKRALSAGAAVLNAAVLGRVHVIGWSEGGPLAMLLAATHPERVLSLVLYGTQACFRREPDYPWDLPRNSATHSAPRSPGSGVGSPSPSTSRLAATTSSCGAGRLTNARARALPQRPS